MEWFRLDSGLPGHPKVGRLARKLKVSKPTALGLLVGLLAWTAHNRELGDLSGLEDDEIADVAGCNGDHCAGAFVAALVECGWLERTPEGGLVIHQWMDRQGYLLKQRERMREHRARTVLAQSSTIHLGESDRQTDRQTDKQDLRARAREVRRCSVCHGRGRVKDKITGATDVCNRCSGSGTEMQSAPEGGSKF